MENKGHSGTKGEGYERGLQFVFERPFVQLTAAQIKNISGTYKSENGNTATSKSEGSKLLLDFGNNNQYTLYNAGENELYAMAEFLNLHLSMAENGTISSFVLERYGGSQTFSKINQ